MPGRPQSNSISAKYNPKRSRADIAAEIERVEAALDSLVFVGEPAPDDLPWLRLGEVSVPVAVRSLRHYRNRLARMA